MAFILEHTRLGFCWWDLVCLIILLIVAGIFIYKFLKMKKIQHDLEDQISEIYSDDTEAEPNSAQA